LSPRVSPQRVHPPPKKPEIFGIPTDQTRRVLAEESLKRAHAYGHKVIGTGHLLLGLIDIDDAEVSAALGGRKRAQHISATAVDLLPGEEAG
jgi:hypothetical protein